MGVILTVGGIAIAVVQIAGEPLSELLSGATLAPLNNSPVGDYGKFELEPTYYPESDAAGFRFKFTF